MEQMTTAWQDQADKTFLALCLWREARGETAAVQAGVVHVILNRVKRPSWWGRDLMSVIFKRWQFSSLTDPKDRQLTTWPTAVDKSWQQCLQIAHAASAGTLFNPVAGADHYYDISIPAPPWAETGRFVSQIGRIRFYDLVKD